MRHARHLKPPRHKCHKGRAWQASHRILIEYRPLVSATVTTTPPVPESALFAAGDQVQLTDARGRMHTITLMPGQRFHTEKGGIDHDDLIGSSEGVVVTSSKGTAYLALRPLLHDFVMSMPRGATIIYPKDAALIMAFADIGPGMRVLEAGAGSGALSCWLLRGVTPTGHLTSVERRPDFAEIAQRNVTKYFGEKPENWALHIGALEQVAPEGPFDRVVLDLLNPWDMLEVVADYLRPGGVLCAYVATTTQLSRTVETLRATGGWTEPKASETIQRGWHVEGLAVRPDHRMVGHTAFLVYSRRLAQGVSAPAKRSRPAKGAYGEDYTGPRAPAATGQVESTSTGNPAEDV